MDTYQNLINGDKRPKITQGNCSEWLLPCYKYYTQNRPKNQDTAANSIRRSSPDVIGDTHPLWMGVDNKIPEKELTYSKGGDMVDLERLFILKYDDSTVDDDIDDADEDYLF